MYDGATILVTGGTGSFGSFYVPYLLKHPIRKVIVYSRDEYKQWAMARNVKDPRVRFFLGDIRDKPRLSHAMKGVDYVVHAAALKHVTAMEYNPQEAYKTNVVGTQNVIESACDAGVRRAVLLSTDKACEPVNLYGATKMVAERLWIAANVHRPSFSFVRYGNVMGSRGGVLGIWKDILDRGGRELPITDLAMTRFWMTLDDAVRAVDRAVENEPGLGWVANAPSFRLVDLMEAMADKAGVEVTKIITGRAPGEKLHETLVTRYEGERARITDDGGYIILPPEREFDESIQYPSWGHVNSGYSFSSDHGPHMPPEVIGERL